MATSTKQAIFSRSSEGLERDFASTGPSIFGSANRAWIQSAAFDLSLFTLSPVAGLIVILAALASPRGAYVGVAAVYFVAVPHYVSSFSFYLGDENLAYYRSRLVAFFVGPIVIMVLVFSVQIFRFSAVLQSVMYVWTIYHVSLQSAGILSIYRRLNGGLVSERRWSRASLLSLNSAMAFWRIDRFPPLYGLLQKMHFPISALAPFLFGVGVIFVLLYGRELHLRRRKISAPELAFLLASFLIFHPYLWVEDRNLATLGMLMGHFLQYLGIVWLLNRRKYTSFEGSVQQRALVRISQGTLVLLLTFVGIGVSQFVAVRATTRLGIVGAYGVFWQALTLIHYYVDGLVWAFKEPFIRKSVGGYLMPESRRVIP